MRTCPPILLEVATEHTPVSLAAQLAGQPGLVLLHSALTDAAQGRYSLLTVRPFLTFRASGSRCETALGESADPNAPTPPRRHVHFGNPWPALDQWLGRYELPDQPDLPFPLGGCFGFWGYDLKNFLEPRLPRRAARDLDLPDCHVGFYDSLVVFDHHLGKTWIIATGLAADGSRHEARARQQAEFWQRHLATPPRPGRSPSPAVGQERAPAGTGQRAAAGLVPGAPRPVAGTPTLASNLSRADFLARVACAQRYIRAGDIYQVNLAQRLAAPLPGSSRALFDALCAVSPAPFAAFLDPGEFQLAAASPELFLRLSGRQVVTRPIKGTRPRAPDADQDARLAYELQTSPKENAELLMITDLLRNDLGKVCDYGSVQVPDLMRLERYAHVQHLVSTVEGRLRAPVTHLAALAACFPGGSITGAPKFRAMEIIDELEPTARGPFTGALGYLGFNRESQLAIIIRTAICKDGRAYFPVGAGIVADSDPAAEYEETLAKAAGFRAALEGLRTGAAVTQHPLGPLPPPLAATP